MRKSLEREIQVVETLINQLNACLALYHKKHMHNEFRMTFADIQKCKEELKKLKTAKETELKADLEIEKGVLLNEIVEAAAIQRS